MKVALLTLERYERGSAGQGIARVINELYAELHKLSHDKSNSLQLDKLVMKGMKFDALSFALGSKLADLSNYEIIHNPIGFLRVSPGKAKYVVTIHDLNPVPGKTLKWRIWHNLFFVPGVRHSINKADILLADTEQTKDELVKKGCESSKISVVPLGVSSEFLKKAKKRAKHDAFRVGYVGSFERNKNVTMLIDALGHIHDKKIRAELWGRAPEHYKDLINKMKSGVTPELKGFAPDERLVDIYDSFDVFIFPSLYEGFGLPILEAQARGLPVVIYKKSRISPEVRKYCIEASDPDQLAEIILKLKGKGYTKTDREKATKYARSFTWRATAEKTLAAYRKVL